MKTPSPCVWRFAALAAVLLFAGVAVAQEIAAFPPLYQSTESFTKAIDAAASLPITPRKLSGLTVPNDLRAADAIARGFRAGADNPYDKIVILFPAHLGRTGRPFETTRRSFSTAFGDVETKQDDVAKLLTDPRFGEEAVTFAVDYGIGTVLPFVRHYLPNTPVVPVAIAAASTPEDWDRLVALLEGIVSPKTLILQTADLAPELPQQERVRNDQEVLNILAANDAGLAGTRLGGAQYVQMRLQATRFRARPFVTFNPQFPTGDGTRAMSGMVQVFTEAVPMIDPPDPSAAETYCFAGDTFFGRNMAKVLGYKPTPERMRTEVKRRLAGCQHLIVNLEGVVVERMPLAPAVMTLAMPKTLTLDWLKDLNVEAVSVANNHRNDMGKTGYEAMTGILEANGIKPIRHGEIADLGRFRLLALTDLDNIGTPFGDRITEDELQAVGSAAPAPPLFTFIHWGVEWQTTPTKRQIDLANRLAQQNASLIVGAHSHRALPHYAALEGGKATVAYSLGNFLFDQFNPRASVAVLEVRFFPQGTFFIRLVPMPNFFHYAIGRGSALAF